MRERVLATYFGTGLHADVFSAGMRLPNVLQNLLGEGTLSASFIPAYSALLGQGRTRGSGARRGRRVRAAARDRGRDLVARRAARAVDRQRVHAGLRRGSGASSLIAVVRILFPMTGVLVLSAWALGILNSHRKFFLPYFAPVLWNAAIIAHVRRVRLAARSRRARRRGGVGRARSAARCSSPCSCRPCWRLDREIRLGTGRREPAFRDAVRKAGPAILGRGVVQLSGYLDLVLASLLAVGAVARLRYAQTLYLLPISLFAMSVAAAALPELARDRDGAVGALRERTVAAVRRVAFFVVPSFVAFVAIGDVLVAGSIAPASSARPTFESSG